MFEYCDGLHPSVSVHASPSTPLLYTFPCNRFSQYYIETWSVPCVPGQTSSHNTISIAGLTTGVRIKVKDPIWLFHLNDVLHLSTIFRTFNQILKCWFCFPCSRLVPYHHKTCRGRVKITEHSLPMTPWGKVNKLHACKQHFSSYHPRVQTGFRTNERFDFIGQW